MRAFLEWVKAEWAKEVFEGFSLEEQELIRLAFNGGHTTAVKNCITAINAIDTLSTDEQRVKLEAEDCCRNVARLNRTGGLKS